MVYTWLFIENHARVIKKFDVSNAQQKKAHMWRVFFEDLGVQCNNTYTVLLVSALYSQLFH